MIRIALACLLTVLIETPFLALWGYRGRRELTQKQVADLMGISQSYISRLEKRIILHLRREMSKLL